MAEPRLECPKPEMRDKPRYPAVVMLQAMDDAGDVSLRECTEQLAQAVVDEFDDDLLVMTVEAGSGEPSWVREENPHQLVVEVPADHAEAAAVIVDALDEHAERYAYTFLDAGALGDDFIAFLVEYLGRDKNVCPALHKRLVQLTRTRFGQAPEPGPIAGVPLVWSVLQTELLDEQMRVENHPHHLILDLLKRILRRLKKSYRGGRTDPVPMPGEASRMPEVVRVVHDGSRVAAWSRPRWARAVTSRRVGLALGGSGSWGYAHVALIDKLVENEVPVDVIASASSGSLMGAYFAVLGSRGNELTIERGLCFDLALALSVMSPVFLEYTVAFDTGFPQLDELEVVFFPVTTNLCSMRSEMVTNASVPWGVRASSTAPGLFGPTMVDDAIYVDGAIADNVPSRLVESLGAGLVVGTNPLPAPPVMRPRSWFGALFQELNPLFRFRELMASFDLMFHEAGDYEGEGHIMYDPPAARYALWRTFDFRQAEKIYREVLAQDEFKCCLQDTLDAWEALTLPRQGQAAD